MVDFTNSLHFNSQVPLYRQLYTALSDMIKSGRLEQGEKLPGKRQMASQLGISINTVDTAYQQLSAEGWIEARPRSGFYVSEVQQLFSTAPSLPTAAKKCAEKSSYKLDLTTGAADTSLFPYKTWSRIQKDLLYSAPDLLEHGPGMGDEELRREVCGYLQSYRGVSCTPENVVIGAGIEYLLGLIAPLLKGPAAVENPGYARTVHILTNNGLSCVPVPVDESGMIPSALNSTDADVAYVTPSHQYPTGVTMPASRRASLLQWAQSKPGRWIIEDDYDSEFRFDLRPLPSLQGMAGEKGPVIYLTTFSKSLAPGIRIAAMVLPQALEEQFARRYSSYSCTVSRFEQHTLARFIKDGHYARHLSRIRNTYRKRMGILLEALSREFGPKSFSAQGLHTGLHMLLRLSAVSDAEAFCRKAAAEGIKLNPLRSYCLADREACPADLLVLGYGGLDENSAFRAVSLLKKLTL